MYKSYNGWVTREIFSMIQQYELMFIVPGSLDDAQVPAIKERAVSFINEAQATITLDVDLGRRRLAYMIKRQTYGHYFLVQFTTEQDTVAALDKKLRLDPEVLRYLLIKALPRTADDITAMLAEPERTQVVEPVVVEQPTPAPVQAEEFGPTVKRDDPAPGETKNVSETEADVAEVEPAAVAEEVVEEDPTKSIEELDKKLDALLDDTNIKL